MLWPDTVELDGASIPLDGVLADLTIRRGRMDIADEPTADTCQLTLLGRRPSHGRGVRGWPIANRHGFRRRRLELEPALYGLRHGRPLGRRRPNRYRRRRPIEAAALRYRRRRLARRDMVAPGLRGRLPTRACSPSSSSSPTQDLTRSSPPATPKALARRPWATI